MHADIRRRERHEGEGGGRRELAVVEDCMYFSRQLVVRLHVNGISP